MIGPRSPLPIVPKAAKHHPAFRGALIQRAEVERIAYRRKSVSFHTLRVGATLYHSTEIKQDLVEGLIDGRVSFKSPSFFMEAPLNVYGLTLIRCQVAIQIRVLDFRNFDTVTALYLEFEARGMFDACDALQRKAHANFQGNDLVSMNSGKFKTERTLDDILIAGVDALGYFGWIMPFKEYDEYMLLDGANVRAVSKINK